MTDCEHCAYFYRTPQGKTMCLYCHIHIEPADDICHNYEPVPV